MSSKVSQLLINIFSGKKNSKLRTDSEVVSDDENENQDTSEENINVSPVNADREDVHNKVIPELILPTETGKEIAIASGSSSTNDNRELVDPNTPTSLNHNISRNNSLTENGSLTSMVNNQLAVNNTQGYNVYQFSNIDRLHIGSVYHISTENNNGAGTTSNVKQTSGNKSPKTIKDNDDVKKTRTIDAMMKSNDTLNYKMMDVIATHLDRWREFVRFIGYSDGQIEQMVEDHHVKGCKEVIYQFLLDWSRNEDDEPTLGKITRLLWKNNHKSCVFKLKENWKTGKLTIDDNCAKQLPDNINDYED